MTMIIHYLKEAKKSYQNVLNYDESYEENEGWEKTVEELQLNHLKIFLIKNLEPFTKLRKLKLLDNCII